MNCIRTKVVPRRTRHGSGLAAARHDGSFLFVFDRLASAQSAVAQGNSFYLFARFTTVDPIRDGSNWYAYCNADPVNYVEAWGERPLTTEEITFATKILGTSINGTAIDYAGIEDFANGYLRGKNMNQFDSYTKEQANTLFNSGVRSQAVCEVRNS